MQERRLAMKDEYLTVCEGHADKNAEKLLPVPPALELNLDDYRAEIAELEISDAQAEQLLGTLWSIMSAFVELGFTVNICEQILEKPLLADSDAAEEVNSSPAKENGDE
jgi:hypothetical protein